MSESVLVDESRVEGMDNNNDDNTTKDLFLTFRIASEEYAIEVNFIKEIITICPVTVVPETPTFIKGIINLRGDIVPVISVRSRFGLPEADYDDATCIIVLDFDDYIIGLIADRVTGVVTIPEENVSPPPSAKLAYSNEYVKSIGKTADGVKLLLDIYKLLF